MACKSASIQDIGLRLVTVVGIPLTIVTIVVRFAVVVDDTVDSLRVAVALVIEESVVADKTEVAVLTLNEVVADVTADWEAKEVGNGEGDGEAVDMVVGEVGALISKVQRK